MTEQGLLDCMCFNSRSAARAVTKFYDRALEPVSLHFDSCTHMASKIPQSDQPLRMI